MNGALPRISLMKTIFGLVRNPSRRLTNFIVICLTFNQPALRSPYWKILSRSFGRRQSSRQTKPSHVVSIVRRLSQNPAENILRFHLPVCPSGSNLPDRLQQSYIPNIVSRATNPQTNEALSFIPCRRVPQSRRQRRTYLTSQMSVCGSPMRRRTR